MDLCKRIMRRWNLRQSFSKTHQIHQNHPAQGSAQAPQWRNYLPFPAQAPNSSFPLLWTLGGCSNCFKSSGSWGPHEKTCTVPSAWLRLHCHGEHLRSKAPDGSSLILYSSLLLPLSLNFWKSPNGPPETSTGASHIQNPNSIGLCWSLRIYVWVKSPDDGNTSDLEIFLGKTSICTRDNSLVCAEHRGSVLT